MNFDFHTGTGSWGRKPQATVLIAGDWAPIRDFAPKIETAPQSLYNDVLPLMQDADFTLINLEAPLSDTGEPVTKSGAVFKGLPCHVAGLTCAGVNAVTLANNHVMDFGLEAFQDTLETLDTSGIARTGAGMDKAAAEAPLLAEINGVKLAIVNFSEGEDLTGAGPGPGVAGWDIPGVCRRIAELRSQGHIVIVVAHCGLEYIPFAPPYVMAAFEAAAEAGAHAVIGHHPHVPQGLCFRNQTPICCSLGNFVFYQPTNFFWRKLGYLVRLGIDTRGLTELTLIPYTIHDSGVSLLAGDETAYFFKRFKEISMPLENAQGINDAWNGFLDHYGPAGFQAEVSGILTRMTEEPGKGAAMFRNRLTTAQHFYHWRDFLHRMVQGDTGSGPAWAKDLAREWLTREREGK